MSSRPAPRPAKTGDLFLWAMSRDGDIKGASYAGALKGHDDAQAQAATYARQRQRYGFAFDPARALRADQLTPGSSSSGQQPGGVVHALTAQPVCRGRLKRGGGEALCNPRLHPFEWAYADPDHPVTCPKCQEILRRTR